MKTSTLTSSKMHERFRKVLAAAPAPATPSASSRLEPPRQVVPGAGAPPTTPSSSSWFEPQLIEILRRPVESGTAHEAHRMKEHEVGELFARLSVAEAWTLHKRLSNPSSTDGLASAFGRLILERRARLLAFLGDARRRAAISQAKRAA